MANLRVSGAGGWLLSLQGPSAQVREAQSLNTCTWTRVRDTCAATPGPRKAGWTPLLQRRGPCRSKASWELTRISGAGKVSFCLKGSLMLRQTLTQGKLQTTGKNEEQLKRSHCKGLRAAASWSKEPTSHPDLRFRVLENLAETIWSKSSNQINMTSQATNRNGVQLVRCN